MMLQLWLRCWLLLSLVLAVASRRNNKARQLLLKQSVTIEKDAVSADAPSHDGSQAESRKELPVYKACGGDFNGVPEGIIEYPGDGKMYPSDSRCIWTITMAPGDKIAVFFAWFHTRNCDDTLLIKNGENGGKIGQYCGKKTIPPFVTQANELYLYFYSNGALNYKGFNMTWRVISNNDEPDEVNQCMSANDKPSTIWNKVDTTGTAILTAVNDKSNNITRTMEIQIHNLQMELEAVKEDQAKVLNDMAGVNSKLDYIIKHLGSCQQHQTTKSPISSSTTTTKTSSTTTTPTRTRTTTTTTTETPGSSRDCTCGIPNPPKRIIGGHAAEPYKYPWHVGLYSESESYDYFCGGTIINTLYVLLAAHCLYPTYPGDLVVGIGDHNQTETLWYENPEDFTELVKVKKAWIHENYDHETLDNDIGVVKLKKHLEFSNGFGIRPICLPDDDTSTYENEMGLIIGWGARDYSYDWGGYNYPHVLQEAEVRVLAPNCNGVYKGITSGMMCAASPGKDACSGDSGGSLAVSKSGQYTQIGITSWGYGCGDEYYPGVYARVTSFLPWIRSLTSDGEICSGSSIEKPSPKPTTPPPSSTCTCGVPNYPKRIINGDPVDPHKYPWHVGIYKKYNTKYFCGGTIINSLFVLTAAHCIINGNLMVGIGDHNRNSLNDDIEITQYVSVATKYKHKDYQDRTSDYDYALLKLSKHIEFNGELGIRPICLPNDDQSTYVNEMAKILGWGRTDYDDSNSNANILQEADVVIYNPGCNNTYPSKDITQQMICAARPGIDACIGDSGGSLAVFEEGQYVIVGVTSWGIDCAHPSWPGVYARVTSVLDWIKGIANEGKYC